MKQSEARDLRSFLEEPVEEIVVEGVNGRPTDPQRTAMENKNVGARFTSPSVGARFTSPSPHTSLLDTPLQGSGVRFTTPWEGTGGHLHEVGARFTGPLGENPSGTNSPITDDLTLQQTMPTVRVAFTPPPVRARFIAPTVSPAPTPGTSQQTLRPYRLQRYQSRGVPVELVGGTLRLPPIDDKGRRETGDLAPAPQKIVPGEPSPALQSWERRRHDMYAWLVLLLLFLLVILGGMGLDSLIAIYR